MSAGEVGVVVFCATALYMLIGGGVFCMLTRIGSEHGKKIFAMFLWPLVLCIICFINPADL